MYADRVAAGRKRSIKERLDGSLDEDLARARLTGGKRQRQNDDKWKHDLYVDEEEPRASNTKVGPRDLRLKLQKRGSQGSGVRDLREKLSGIMHPQPENRDPSKVKSVPVTVQPIKKTAPSVEAPVSEPKKVPNPASSKKKTQKSNSTVEGLLQSLGLEKYLINFQAEEVDMTALMHMTDQDLKALGIPMGPRKKIILALDSKA